MILWNFSLSVNVIWLFALRSQVIWLFVLRSQVIWLFALRSQIIWLFDLPKSSLISHRDILWLNFGKSKAAVKKSFLMNAPDYSVGVRIFFQSLVEFDLNC